MKKGQDTSLEGSKLGIALSWERGAQAIDLDLQAVAFDSRGKPLDAVYYNNLKALGRGLTHSGDEVTGAKKGFDEVVWVNMPKLPKEVALIAFVVASYKGGRVRDAQDSKYHILQDSISRTVGSFGLQKIDGQAALLGCMFKGRNSQWLLRLIEESAAEGQHFIDILEPTIGGAVRQLIPSAPKRIKASFAMDKGSVVELPMSAALGGIFAGLAWDTTAGEVDLDVSAIQLDAAGQEVDTVFFGNLEGEGITHSGDNLTGEGAGDDEVITLNLDALSPRVQQIYFVINIYSKGKTFAQVANPRCRIFEHQDGAESELCHYLLAEATHEAALIMGRLFRAPGDVRWGFQAVGEPCRGRTWKDSVPQVTRHAATPAKGHHTASVSRSGSVVSESDAAQPACLRDASPHHPIPTELFYDSNEREEELVTVEEAPEPMVCGECCLQ